MKTSMYTTPVKPESEEKDILVIPDFINLQIWGEFLEMRRRMKRSLTLDGMKLLVEQSAVSPGRVSKRNGQRKKPT